MKSELYLVKLLASVSVSVLVSMYVVGSVCGNSHRRMCDDLPLLFFLI